jgi:hypothetical protein
VISRLDLDQRVREWGVSEEVVEKNYVLGWVLSPTVRAWGASVPIIDLARRFAEARP